MYALCEVSVNSVNKISEMQLPIQILSVGAFGKAVAVYLKHLHLDVFEIAADNDVLPMPATWPAARISLLASWKPVPAVCELLDDVCHKWMRPFIPLILDSRHMRVGPVIVPGQEGCWKCWSLRYRKQLSFPADYAALLDHYDSQPDSGPRGFLEPFAMMGAARLAHAIRQTDSGIDEAGRVWQVDMLTGAIAVGRVIGAHGCDRCGLRRKEDSRGFADMQIALNYLWAPNEEKDGTEDNSRTNREKPDDFAEAQ
jgi:bacteriocin biosynthesis cyclodehydratase domain-containing protein